MALQFDPNINIPDNNGRVEKIVVSVDICWASLITFAVLLPPTSSPSPGKVTGVNSGLMSPDLVHKQHRAEQNTRHRVVASLVPVGRSTKLRRNFTIINHGEGPYWGHFLVESAF